MFFDPKPPNPKQLQLIAFTPDQLKVMEKEFHLDKFDCDTPFAIIAINQCNFLYINVRDPEDRDIRRDAKRLVAMKPIGQYRGIRPSARNTVLCVMNSTGVKVEWQPCGPSGPTLSFRTCFNSGSAHQLFCPQ